MIDMIDIAAIPLGHGYLARYLIFDFSPIAGGQHVGIDIAHEGNPVAVGAVITSYSIHYTKLYEEFDVVVSLKVFLPCFSISNLE